MAHRWGSRRVMASGVLGLAVLGGAGVGAEACKRSAPDESNWNVDIEIVGKGTVTDSVNGNSMVACDSSDAGTLPVAGSPLVCTDAVDSSVTTVTLSAAAGDPTWRFDHWANGDLYNCPQAQSQAAQISVQRPTGDAGQVGCRAVFVEQEALVVDVYGYGTVTVAVGDAGLSSCVPVIPIGTGSTSMSCTYYGSGTYELGEMAGDGWGFIGWFGDCPDPGTGTTTTVTVTPDSSATCTATFRNRSDGGACVTFGQMCSDTSGPCCPTAAGMAIPCDGLVPPDDPTGTCCSSLTCDPQGNGCCAGFQCDLASGKCFVPDGGTESGTDAGGDAAEAGPTCTEPLAACTSTGQCCQYTLANGEPVQPACNGNECCVNWNGGDCRTSLDCCGTYPCTPIGTAGDTQCCEPAQGPCMVATDCCIAGAANNQCNGNKCCISTGYTCGNGGTLHNEACCSNVCLSNGQCQ